ncbi:MAG: acyl-CoA dehydrogenase [Pseudomonadota bacterium]
MNFDFSEEQAMLRETVARYMREQYGFEARRKLLAGDTAWSASHWKQYAQFGWLGLIVPEEFGGLACSFMELALVLEQMGTAMALEPIIASAVLSTRLIDVSGNQALRAHWLPQLAAGVAIFALAHDEPANHDQAALPQTQALPEAGGFRLRGHKTMVLGGCAADHYIVAARIVDGEAERLGLFVLDATCPGLVLEPYRLVDGRGAADLRLDDVDVPAAALLAEGVAAASALDEALDWARLAAMSEALGAIVGCLDATSAYVKTRVQFGQKIGKFQAVQHLMAEMFVDSQESRSILFQGIVHLDDDAVARRRAIDATKVVIGEAGRRVAAIGVQLHGGYGMTEEYRISHHFRQLFVLEKLFGDSRVCLERMS